MGIGGGDRERRIAEDGEERKGMGGWERRRATCCFARARQVASVEEGCVVFCSAFDDPMYLKLQVEAFSPKEEREESWEGARGVEGEGARDEEGGRDEQGEEANCAEEETKVIQGEEGEGMEGVGGKVRDLVGLALRSLVVGGGGSIRVLSLKPMQPWRGGGGLGAAVGAAALADVSCRLRQLVAVKALRAFRMQELTGRPPFFSPCHPIQHNLSLI